MKILVVGGVGFIGSHVCQVLKGWEHQPYIMDAYRVYIQPVQPWYIENMQYRLTRLINGVPSYRGSVSDCYSLWPILNSNEFDCIIHLAVLPIANQVSVRTAEAFNSMIQGTFNLLQYCSMSGTKLVYISSSMAYGDFVRVPVTEDDKLNPISIYGGMKLAGEVLVRSFSQANGFPAVIIRPSAVYGPSDCNMRVVQKFLHAAFRGQPITVVRGEDSVLDFTCVNDVALGIVQAATKHEADGRIFNMTAGDGRTLDELVHVILNYFPDLEVWEREGTNRRPKRGELDISKAREILDYSPWYSLESGVRCYYRWMKETNRSLHE